MEARRPLAEQLDRRIVDEILSTRNADAAGEFRAG
jgi:hypothetical protein